jgi:dTDP-4-amino-4,6-dideoxygalactose transaminase
MPICRPGLIPTQIPSARFDAMIPYGRQDISQADIDAVVEVLRSDFLTQGPMVPRFEEAVAQYCGAQHGVAANSATSALHIACLALDLGSSDWLWTSPNTFVASANCALYCGAKVDFVDIDPRTYNMSVGRLKEKLTQAEKEGRLPKIVMPVHFAGQTCDMPAIHALSQQYGFKIIEDASHAIGAHYVIAGKAPSVIARSEATRQSTPVIASGEAAWQSSEAKQSTSIKVGSCTHSDITVFSYHPVKIITTGEGGMAMTNDSELADRLRRLRTHGITNDKALMYLRPDNEIWNYQQIELGFNYRMTDIQAALGLGQMQRLDEFVRRRHEIAERYDVELSSLPITTPHQATGTYSSYHLYPIRVPEIESGKAQRQVYDALWKNGVAANLHYIPVHRQPYYERLGFKAGDFPEAEQLHREVISLPMYSTLTNEQQADVIRMLAFSEKHHEA